MVQALATNNYGPAKFIVDATLANGTHSTIATALTSASSGDTIFIRPGTYTENITLKAGVNLTAYGTDSSLNGTGNVIINGTASFSSAGSVTISGIMLQTNSAALLSITGSAASIVNLNNCYLNCSNNTGITFSVANISAALNISYCKGNLGTTGIAFLSDSSTGMTTILSSQFLNSGGSSTASTKSAGQISIIGTYLNTPITYSSSNIASGMENCQMDNSVTNSTGITTSGTGNFTIYNSAFQSGSASAISIGTGTTLAIFNSAISSTNTNAVTGAGTLNCAGICYNGTSHLCNVTTNTASGSINGLTQGTAPAAGFVGEQIRSSVASGSAISYAGGSGSATTITSINLTAGIWDISAIATSIGTGNFTVFSGGISATTNAFGLAQGDAYQSVGLAGSSGAVSVSIPSYRVTISTTTTYYLVGALTFSTGAGSGYGRISGTRVG